MGNGIKKKNFQAELAYEINNKRLSSVTILGSTKSSPKIVWNCLNTNEEISGNETAF